MANSTPVLICGAGPTGMTLALELARFGVDVRLIDRDAGGARFSQALAIQPRTLELLEPQGITDALLARMRRVTRGRIETRGRLLTEVDLGGLPTEDGHIKWPLAFRLLPPKERQELRDPLEGQLALVTTQASSGAVDGAVLSDVARNAARLSAWLKAHRIDMAEGTYRDGVDFLRMLDATVAALQR